MEKSKTLFVLVGPPASGKSTWAQEYLTSMNESVLWVSRDKIRFSIVNENEDYFSQEKLVYSSFINSIKTGLETHDTVIADATHIAAGSRKKLFKALGDSIKEVEVIAMVVKVDYKTALARNAERRGREYVPPCVLESMYESFTIPTLEEGFDQIWIYENNRYIVTKEVD